MTSPMVRRTMMGSLTVSGTGGSRTIRFQYNPANLRRSLDPQFVGGHATSSATRPYYTAPPVEQITVRLEIDAGDQDSVTWNDSTTSGIRPLLAAIETVMYPTVASIESAVSKLSSGTLEIGQYTAPTVMFQWGKQLQAPVLITKYAVTEDAFDVNLNPIRATVDLTMQVTSATDLLPTDPGFARYLAYQSEKERAAAKVKS